MLFSPVARVWAEAIFDMATESGREEETGQELADLVSILRGQADVAEFLDSPVLEPSVKVQRLRKALDGSASESVVDFLCLLVEKRRTSALPQIAEAFQHMLDVRQRRARVSVRTARPLSAPLRGEIQRALEGALGKSVVLEEEVTPAILGGATVTVGDTVYDGSVRQRLNAFHKRIMRSGGYEAQG